MNLPKVFRALAIAVAPKRDNRLSFGGDSQKLSLYRDWWLWMAPEELRILKRTVDSWFSKSQTGTLSSRDDLAIVPSGLAEWPNLHHYLFKSAQFAEQFSGHTRIYQDVTDLIVNGLRGLTVYALTDPAALKNRVSSYNGCINSTTWLLRKEGEQAKFVNEGSGLEGAILQQFSESFHSVHGQKARDGEGMQYGYLLNSLREYSYGESQRQFTIGLREKMKEVFVQIYGSMNPVEKKELNNLLDTSYPCTEEFREFVRDIMKRAEGVVDHALVHGTFRDRGRIQPSACFLPARQ